MDKNRFNAEVRPYLTEIPIGTRGVAFDRVDLDVWFEDYKSRSGRPGKVMERGTSWGRKSHQDLSSVPVPGTSKRQSQVDDFGNVLGQVTSMRRKDTLRIAWNQPDRQPLMGFVPSGHFVMQRSAL